jgi:hypothetical protein
MVQFDSADIFTPQECSLTRSKIHDYWQILCMHFFSLRVIRIRCNYRIQYTKTPNAVLPATRTDQRCVSVCVAHTQGQGGLTSRLRRFRK